MIADANPFENRYRPRGSVRGFTLIELMIVVAIVAILSAIAIPAYTHYVLVGRRADGMSALTDAQNAMEACYGEYDSYQPANGACPALPTQSPQGYYVIRESNLSPSTYTLTATPTGPQAADTGCTSLSTNQLMQHLWTGTSSRCWQ